MSTNIAPLLQKLTPKAIGGVDAWVAPLTSAKEKLGEFQFKMFLAQGIHETLNLTKLEENLNYSSPERLVAIFPRCFKTVADATPYIKNAKGLEKILYEGYKGRGLLHLTWKKSYRLFEDASGVGCVSDPELLLQPKHAVGSAVWFWETNGIGEKVSNAFKKNGSNDRQIFDLTTRAINGPAMMHAEERFRLYQEIDS